MYFNPDSIIRRLVPHTIPGRCLLFHPIPYRVFITFQFLVGACSRRLIPFPSEFVSISIHWSWLLLLKFQFLNITKIFTYYLQCHQANSVALHQQVDRLNFIFLHPLSSWQNVVHGQWICRKRKELSS